jgi:Divergent InlB B-repeat domain
MWRHLGLLTTLVTAFALLLPAAGQTRLPPEDDGSTYTWPGAATMTVDVQPWGAGYVRSDPYKIDCPLACVRPFEPGRVVTLTAYVTPGFTFESWTGACEGQANPCTLTTAGAAVDVTAVYSGHYVPPAPPPSGPMLTTSVSGDCPGCTASAVGTGFHPNSSITLHVEISSPGPVSADVPNFATTDASGTWTYTGNIPCDFGDGPYVGPFVEDIVATDEQGASASGHVTANCVAT